jgi:hypothetical protein
MINELCHSILSKIYDYRAGEIPEPDISHIKKWVRQFPEYQRVNILQALDYVFDESYFSKQKVTDFMKNCVSNKVLSKDMMGGDPLSFWKKVNFLNIQMGGNSQQDLLDLFNTSLEKVLGISIKECGSTECEFIYFDDVSFSGNRIRSDLEHWIENSSPSRCKVNIIVMATHSGGRYYASTKLKEKSIECGKDVNISWWNLFEIEDRKRYMDSSEVLCPTRLPADNAVQEYIKILTNAGYPPQLRKVTNPPYKSVFFKSERDRQLLEEIFLIQGAKILQMCPNLSGRIRPLGFQALKTLGFGSMIITYRNCPNTCPPALWAGDPWYPLFLRKTN